MKNFTTTLYKQLARGRVGFMSVSNVVLTGLYLMATLLLLVKWLRLAKVFLYCLSFSKREKEREREGTWELKENDRARQEENAKLSETLASPHLQGFYMSPYLFLTLFSSSLSSSARRYESSQVRASAPWIPRLPSPQACTPPQRKRYLSLSLSLLLFRSTIAGRNSLRPCQIN